MKLLLISILIHCLIYNFPLFCLLQQIQWLNDYNARVRIMVGEELKKQYSMESFYWMMNNTMHVKEYFTESEYRARTSQSNFIHFGQWMSVVTSIAITLLLARWARLWGDYFLIFFCINQILSLKKTNKQHCCEFNFQFFYAPYMVQCRF